MAQVAIYNVNEPDLAAIDITAPNAVEIKVREDKKVVWVNVDGICRFRACCIGELTLDIPNEK